MATLEGNEVLEVEITRDFGGVSVTYRHKVGTAILDKNTRDIIYRGLEELLMNRFKEFSRDHLNDLPAPAAPQSTKFFEGGRLTVELKDGQKRYKYKVGSFEKFGVPVYHEALKQSGFTEADVDIMTGFDLTGWRAKVEFEGDKPKRALYFERVVDGGISST